MQNKFSYESIHYCLSPFIIFHLLHFIYWYILTLLLNHSITYFVNISASVWRHSCMASKGYQVNVRYGYVLWLHLSLWHRIIRWKTNATVVGETNSLIYKCTSIGMIRHIFCPIYIHTASMRINQTIIELFDIRYAQNLSVSGMDLN